MTKDIPHLQLNKLKARTEILIETATHVFNLTVVSTDPLIVEVESTDPLFNQRTAPRGYFLGARRPNTNDFVEGALVKGWNFEVKFRDITMVGTDVVSAKLYGDGWSYDVF